MVTMGKANRFSGVQQTLSSQTVDVAFKFVKPKMMNCQAPQRGGNVILHSFVTFMSRVAQLQKSSLLNSVGSYERLFCPFKHVF